MLKWRSLGRCRMRSGLQWKMVREFLMDDDSEREDKDESDDDSGE